jgi:hypothetical protein
VPEQRKYSVLKAASPEKKPQRLGSVSVLSDCSVGSFVTEPALNQESYGRIKTELRQIQRDYKVTICGTLCKVIHFSAYKRTDLLRCQLKKQSVVYAIASLCRLIFTNPNSKNLTFWMAPFLQCMTTLFLLLVQIDALILNLLI